MDVKITNVRFERVTGKWDYQAPLQEQRLVRPIDIYPEFRALGPGRERFGRESAPPYSVSDIFETVSVW